MVNHRVSKCPWPAKRSEADKGIDAHPDESNTDIEDHRYHRMALKMSAFKCLQIFTNACSIQ